MPDPSPDLVIGPELVARYDQGELTLDGLAALLGASLHAVRRALRALNVDTSISAGKRRQATYRWEKARGLGPGTAYAHAAELYRKGHSLEAVARDLGCCVRAVMLILDRVGVETRPVWNREVFRDAEGRQLDLGPFAEKLKALRLSRSLTQRRVGELCDLSPSTIGYWENGTKGPCWAALYRLVSGLEIDKRELGVDADWPTAIPAGLLGPRHRKAKRQPEKPAPTPVAWPPPPPAARPETLTPAPAWPPSSVQFAPAVQVTTAPAPAAAYDSRGYEPLGLSRDWLLGSVYCYGYTYDVYRPGDAGVTTAATPPKADTPHVVVVSPGCRGV